MPTRCYIHFLSDDIKTFFTDFFIAVKQARSESLTWKVLN